MSNGKILPRQLSTAGCKGVGEELAGLLEGFKKRGQALAPAIEVSAGVVLAATERLKNFSHERESMSDIDHGTDDTISPFYEWLYAAVEFYSHPHAHIIPLTPDEQLRLRHFRTLLDELFPEGTYFLSLRHKEQWLHLERLQRALSRPELQARLSEVGLSPEAARISKWIERYGTRLGIMAAEPEVADPLAQLVLEWHDAWSDFTVDVRSTYKGKAELKEAELRSLLLSAYDKRLEEERAKERQSRSKRPH